MLLKNRFIGALSALGGGFAALALLTSLTAQAHAETLYVATNGTDQNDDPAYRAASRTIISDYTHPARTIANAVSLANYGDDIQVASGNYEPFDVFKKSNLYIQGQPGATIRARSSSDNNALINVGGSSYIVITGFEVTGKNAGNTLVSGPDCNGIIVAPYIAPEEPEVISHHVYIKNCKVHDVGGGGILSLPARYPRNDMGGDYIEITNNEIWATNSTGQYAGSAVSLLVARNYDGTGGFHNKIEGNRIYSNIINTDAFKQTDCNGIIIDSANLQDTAATATTPANPAPGVLIQNNVIYNNSGRGIEVLDSNNVTVLNNTLYKNNLSPVITDKGELYVGGFNAEKPVHDVKFSNNVVQASDESATPATDSPAFRARGILGDSVVFKNNTYKSTPVPSYLSVTNSADYTTTMNHIDWNTTIESLSSYGELFKCPTPSDLGLANFGLRTLATRYPLDERLSQTARNRGSKTNGEYAFWSFNGYDRSAPNVPGGYLDRGAYEQ